MVILNQTKRNTRNGIPFAGLALVLTLALAGCGGGGGSSSVNAVVPGNPSSHVEAASAFTITGDDYGIQKATYLTADTSGDAMVLRAAIASSLTDPAFRTTVRIDVDHASRLSANTTYALGSTAGTPFPGTLYFFDGHTSSLLQTVGGTITFTAFGTSGGAPVIGSFTATVKDGNDSAGSTYTISADFSFAAGNGGPVTPATAPIPTVAAATYDANCASCHSLGSYDGTASGGCELALKGGKLRDLMVPDTASHQGIRLAASQIAALQVLLNAN